jgi:hypothetical protein
VKIDTKDAFLRRIGQLRVYGKQTGKFKSEAALAREIGISRAMYYALLESPEKVSKKTLDKVSEAEVRAGLRPATTHVRYPTESLTGPDRLLSSGMVAESSSSDGELTSWQDVEAYVRTLKLTHRGLPPDEVLELLQQKYPLSPEKKT